MKKNLCAISIIMFLFAFFPFGSFAQEKFPGKPIFINIGQGAGGSTDIIARAFSPFTQNELKVPVIVQNQPGAAGDVANNYLWKAKPDGYNLLMTVIPSYTLRELIKKQIFKTLDMSFIYGIAGGDFNAISVPYNSPIKNFDDLKREASSKALSAGATTQGSNSWYAYILLREATGIKFKYVPYESGTEAATAAGGGHVDLAITSIISAVQPAQNKLIRLIAMFGEKRDPTFPDVPTMIDLGYKDVHFTTRQGLVGPPGMDKEVITITANAIAKAIKDPKFKEIADRQGFTIDAMPGPEFRKWTGETFEQARKVLTKAGEVKQ
jgi:tripartite-type tricarboxylate transporter receptor subunit TctC